METNLRVQGKRRTLGGEFSKDCEEKNSAWRLLYFDLYFLTQPSLLTFILPWFNDIWVNWRLMKSISKNQSILVGKIHKLRWLQKLYIWLLNLAYFKAALVAQVFVFFQYKSHSIANEENRTREAFVNIASEIDDFKVPALLRPVLFFDERVESLGSYIWEKNWNIWFLG